MAKLDRIKVLQYNVLFTLEKEGGYSVSVPDLPGCHSQGETFEEAQENIKEAIELYLESTDKKQRSIFLPTEAKSQFMSSVSVDVNA